MRATKDLDVWVRPSSDNAERVRRALAAFGAPLQGLAAKDLERPGLIFQIGVAPLRVDVLTSIDGVEFEPAWRDRVRTTFAGVPGDVISTKDLVANKKAAGRLQDLADVEELERRAERESK